MKKIIIGILMIIISKSISYVDSAISVCRVIEVDGPGCHYVPDVVRHFNPLVFSIGIILIIWGILKILINHYRK